MRKRTTQPAAVETPAINTRTIIWDSFMDFGIRTKTALKGPKVLLAVQFFISNISPTQMGMEVSRIHGLDEKKNIKNIPTVTPLVAGETELQGVHWLVTLEDPSSPTASVLRSTTSRKLGIADGMGKGPRTTAVFEQDEQSHIWTPGDLLTDFRSSISLVAPASIRGKLAAAQIIEPVVAPA